MPGAACCCWARFSIRPDWRSVCLRRCGRSWSRVQAVDVRCGEKILVITRAAVRIRMAKRIARVAAVWRAQKGDESDESLHDLGGLLSDLFRSRFLLQFLFVRLRRCAYGTIASAAFPRSCWQRAYAC